MTIIKIHGCSGAGKTTAIRELMKDKPYPIYGNNGKIEAYRLDEDKFVLGSYENTCGGVDVLSGAPEVMKLLDKYAVLGHVLFEGLLQSTYYGALGAHSIRYGDKYVYAFLDTPADLCLERVVQRRAKSGNTRKFNPQLTLDKHATIAALKTKLEQNRVHRVVTLKHDQPLAPQLLELL